MDESEVLDILNPPLFEKTGVTKTREQAYNDGDWVGTFNMWIVQRKPVPALVYQIRSPKKPWAPGKFDLPAAGHYLTGETMTDGLREAEEELGRTFDPKDLIYLGRKIHVSRDVKNRLMHNLIEVYLVEDDLPITKYTPNDEVYALCVCPLYKLIRVHTEKGYSFKTTVHKTDGTRETVTVSADSFPENWDNYHHKMAQLAQRYINGDKPLLY